MPAKPWQFVHVRLHWAESGLPLDFSNWWPWAILVFFWHGAKGEGLRFEDWGDASWDDKGLNAMFAGN